MNPFYRRNMRRSEAANKIQIFLEARGYCGNCDDGEALVEYLIEELQMLPPKILNPIIKKEPFYKEGMKTGYLLAEVADYYRGETPYKTFVNEWEPEE